MLNFLIFDHILCLYKRMFLFLGNTLTKTGIKAHNICNLISNDLEKNCTWRGGRSDKKKKIGQNGNNWRTWVKTVEVIYTLLVTFKFEFTSILKITKVK